MFQQNKENILINDFVGQVWINKYNVCVWPFVNMIIEKIGMNETYSINSF